MVVKRAPHCPHTCGFVSSNDEFRRFRCFGGVFRINCGGEEPSLHPPLPDEEPGLPDTWRLPLGDRDSGPLGDRDRGPPP